MSYKLIPPGRRGNKVYYARISVAGRQFEVSTRTADKKLAGAFARQAERARYEALVLGAAPQPTVAEVINGYISFRRPRPVDERRLEKIAGYFGDRVGLTQPDVDTAARVLYPGAAAETWNRNIYTPLSAAYRHAGVAWNIRRPRQGKAENKFVSEESRDVLLENAEPGLRALLTLMFYTGARISEATALTWDRVNLKERWLVLDQKKTGTKHRRHIHDRLLEALGALPGDQAAGRVFQWQTRFGPRKALAKLREKTGVVFTPHMARHSFATHLRKHGADLADIQEAGGWASLNSVRRYAGEDKDRQKVAVNRL
jgi:integrase